MRRRKRARPRGTAAGGRSRFSARGARRIASSPLAIVGVLAVACGVRDFELGGHAAAVAGAGPALGGAAGSSATGPLAGWAGSDAGGASERGGAAGSGGIVAAGAQLPGLVGWAAVADCGPRGTVGGDGGPVVTPATVDELRSAVAAPGPALVELRGEYALGDEVLDVGSDKTLVGVDGAVIVGTVRLDRVTNVVLQNLRVDGAETTGSRDAVELTGATCVWIDHAEILDGADGNLDIVRGADLVTVSWSYFHYVTKDDGHRYSNLCGADDTDTPGKLNVTFHHDWWGTGVLSQMPRVRYGEVHVFDSYYSAAGNQYCIGAGYQARLLVENNVFDGVKDPIRFQLDEDPDTGEHTAEIVQRGNDVSAAEGAVEARGAAFEPPYPYELEPVSSVRASVMEGAGPR